VLGECRPSQNGASFLAFLKKAVKPHTGKEIHVVLDNLSTHTTPEVKAWLASNPHAHFHFTPVGSSWINQIETVRHPHPAVDPPRHILQRKRSGQAHPRVHRHLKLPGQTVHLDRHH
jgi:hypothetical protein